MFGHLFKSLLTVLLWTWPLIFSESEKTAPWAWNSRPVYSNGGGGVGGDGPRMGSHTVYEKCSGVEGAELSHLGAQEKTLALLMEGESRTM